MKHLFILNDAPYGSERSYNGLRLALALGKLPDTELQVFLMADGVFCAKGGQSTPEGYYNIQRMLHGLVAKGAEVACCGTCMDARGMADGDLSEGTRRSTMAELAAWTVAADRVQVW